MSGEFFSIVDTETTGLFPGGNDRIAEIAIVTMNSAGHDSRLLGKHQSTRNAILASNQSIASRAAMCSMHPASRTWQKNCIGGFRAQCSWRIICPSIPDSLRLEFRKCGLPVPETFLAQGMCTMRMSHRYFQGAGRSLQDCCDSFGIDLQQAHSAVGDATATATLLSRYMELDPDEPEWDGRLRLAAAGRWFDSMPRSRVAPVKRSQYRTESAGHFLEKLAARLPEFSGTAYGGELLCRTGFSIDGPLCISP